MKHWLRVGATLLVTGGAVAYILFKIDLGKTWDILRAASPWWIALSAVLTLITVPPMAWRWQLLLAARGVVERLLWLTRTYFVSYAVGQVLPTSVGGDASRIFETSRRHPGQITPITGSVLLERSIGGAVTLVLAGVGFLSRSGATRSGRISGSRCSSSSPRWPRAASSSFSRSARAPLAFLFPHARRFRLEVPARAVYDGIHGYRDHVGHS